MAANRVPATKRYEPGLTPAMLVGATASASGGPITLALDYDGQLGMTVVTGEITAWADQSGNANNLVKGTTGMVVNPAAGPGGRVAATGGVGRLLTSSTQTNVPRSADPKTVFVVVRQTSFATDQFYFHVDDSSGGWFIASEGPRFRGNIQGQYTTSIGTYSVNQTMVGCMTHDGAGVITGTVNGVYGTSLSVTPPTLKANTALVMGDYAQSYGQAIVGDIARIIVFNGVLTPAAILRLNTYLSAFYGS